ncbi:MAG: hypothetical protein HY863_02215 [Chloroflexi bacterium]|nr:hypothetical protein [Chloroflexota bacterium]
MKETDFIETDKPRLGNVKIARFGVVFLFNKQRIQGGDSSAVLLNLPKEVIFS